MNFADKPEKSGEEILVVEDSRVQAAAVSKMLIEEGDTGESASDGLDGLSVLALSRPDLIISDVWMPRMNGYEFCRTLKTDGTLKDIPVILLTSMSSFRNILEGLNAGADYYLTKPYSKDLLLGMVKSIVSGSLQ